MKLTENGKIASVFYEHWRFYFILKIQVVMSEFTDVNDLLPTFLEMDSGKSVVEWVHVKTWTFQVESEILDYASPHEWNQVP